MRDDPALNAWLQATAESMDPDPGHAEHVAFLSSCLYSALHAIQPGGGFPLLDRDPCLLNAAAWLHDIGWSGCHEQPHHKNSFHMIRGLQIPGCNAEEVLLVALIARYHRKSEPDAARHRWFAGLNETDQSRVEWLAAILRIADGLDRSHQSRVSSLTIHPSTSGVTIVAKGDAGLTMEIWGARRKAGLLERKLGFKLEIRG